MLENESGHEAYARATFCNFFNICKLVYLPNFRSLSLSLSLILSHACANKKVKSRKEAKKKVEGGRFYQTIWRFYFCFSRRTCNHTWHARAFENPGSGKSREAVAAASVRRKSLTGMHIHIYGERERERERRNWNSSSPDRPHANELHVRARLTRR